MRKIHVLSVAFLLSLAPLVPLALAQGTYTNIDVPGSGFTYAYGINNAGEVVGTYLEDQFEHGFILSGGTYTTVEYPGADDTVVVGINDKGRVVGIGSPGVGFLYDRSTGSFTDVVHNGAAASSALAINNRGTIIGFSYPDVPFELNAQGRGATIKIPGATFVNPYGINDSGSVVGTYGPHGGGEASFEFRPGKFRRVTIPNAPLALVYATNPSGTALAGTYYPGAPTDSFLYRNGIVQTVAYPGARATYAFGVNDAGQVSGIYYTETDGPHGFLWTPPADAAEMAP